MNVSSFLFYALFILIMELFIYKYIYKFFGLLQSEHYKIRAIVTYVYKSILHKKYVYLYIGIYFVVLLIFKCNNILSVLFEVFTIFYLVNDDSIVKVKPKKTSRLVRIVILSTAIYFVSILTMLVSIKLMSIMIVLGGVYLLYYVSTMLAIIMLKPVEYFIGQYYIHKTKVKLQKLNTLKVIAITGSFGKTSVKNILYKMLSVKYRVVMSPYSYNTPFGLTKTILERVTESTEILILEMGVDRLNDMSKLLSIVSPKYCIVTNIGRQHMQSLKSINNVISEKFKLVNFVKASQGVVVVNNYNLHIFKHTHTLKCRVLKTKMKYLKLKNIIRPPSLKFILSNYISDGKNYYTYLVDSVDHNGSKFKLYVNNYFECDLCTKLLGEYNIKNVILAIAMARVFNVSYTQIRVTLNAVECVDSRMQILHKANGGIIINNGYNSNIDSCKETLKTLNLFKGKDIIVITPGFIECGKHAYKYNYTLGQYLSKVATKVYVVGSMNANAITSGLINSGFSNSNIIKLSSRSEWVSISNNVKPNEVILFENDVLEKY